MAHTVILAPDSLGTNAQKDQCNCCWLFHVNVSGKNCGDVQKLSISSARSLKWPQIRLQDLQWKGPSWTTRNRSQYISGSLKLIGCDTRWARKAMCDGTTYLDNIYPGLSIPINYKYEQVHRHSDTCCDERAARELCLASIRESPNLFSKCII